VGLANTPNLKNLDLEVSQVQDDVGLASTPNTKNLDLVVS
jgi:hypothetical protein